MLVKVQLLPSNEFCRYCVDPTQQIHVIKQLLQSVKPNLSTTQINSIAINLSKIFITLAQLDKAAENNDEQSQNFGNGKNELYTLASIHTADVDKHNDPCTETMCQIFIRYFNFPG